MEILAISLDAYGDQVLRQPLMSALLDAGHAVTLAIRPAYSDIVPFLDSRLKVLACDIDTEAARSEALEQIRHTRPEAVVALAFNRTPFDNAILRACSDASRFALIDAGPGRGPRVAGNGHERPAEIDAIAAEIEHPIHVAGTSREHAKNSAIFHAISGLSARLSRPRLQASPEFSGIAARFLVARGFGGAQFVVMGGAGSGTIKALPVNVAVDSIIWLHKNHGLRTLLTGVSSELEQLESIAALASERGVRPEIYIGRTREIGELLALVSASQAYVGADTGTMHLAAALGRPVAALFGGGHFPRFEPEADRWFATTKRLLCFGCGWRCIYGKPRCILEVDAHTWFDGIGKLVEGASPGWVFAPGSIDRETADAASGEFRAVIDILATVEHDRAQRLEAIEVLTRHNADLENALRISESDRAARLELINQQAAQVAMFEHAAQERLALLEASKAEHDRLVEELAIVKRGS